MNRETRQLCPIAPGWKLLWGWYDPEKEKVEFWEQPVAALALVAQPRNQHDDDEEVYMVMDPVVTEEEGLYLEAQRDQAGQQWRIIGPGKKLRRVKKALAKDLRRTYEREQAHNERIQEEAVELGPKVGKAMTGAGECSIAGLACQLEASEEAVLRVMYSAERKGYVERTRGQGMKSAWKRIETSENLEEAAIE